MGAGSKAPGVAPIITGKATKASEKFGRFKEGISRNRGEIGKYRREWVLTATWRNFTLNCKVVGIICSDFGVGFIVLKHLSTLVNL